MADRRRKLIAGLAALVAFSLVVCPLGWGAAGAPARAAAQGTQFDIPTIVGTPVTMPTPIPTVGPGQYFEEEQRPAIISAHGDDEFGWGEILGSPDLVLVWVTDESGTHYLVLEKDDEQFTGSVVYGEDGTPVGVLNDGFEDFISQREAALREMDISFNEAIGSSIAGAVLAGGLTLCPATGGGGCIAGVVGGFAVAFGNGVRTVIRMFGVREQVVQLEERLLGRFQQAVTLSAE